MINLKAALRPNGISVQVRCYEKLDKENEQKWLEFWNSCRHSHFQQHPLYAKAQLAQNKSVVYVMAEEEGRVVGAGVFAASSAGLGYKGLLEVTCLRGPTFDDASVGKEILSHAIKHFDTSRVGCITLCPYWTFPDAETIEPILKELGFKWSECGKTARSNTGLIDITQSEEQLLASLPKKTRYEIRRAGRLGVEIRPAGSMEEANLFYTHLSDMHRQRGIIDIDPKEFNATFETILKHQDVGVVLNANYGDKFIGGLFVFRGSRTCHIARYVVVKSFSEQVANLTIAPALLWQGIQWAKSKGCDTIDVECYEENLDPAHLWHNFMKTKRDFNAKPAQIIAPHSFVVNSLGCKICRAVKFYRKVARRGIALLYGLKQKIKHAGMHFGLCIVSCYDAAGFAADNICDYFM